MRTYASRIALLALLLALAAPAQAMRQCRVEAEVRSLAPIPNATALRAQVTASLVKNTMKAFKPCTIELCMHEIRINVVQGRPPVPRDRVVLNVIETAKRTPQGEQMVLLAKLVRIEQR